MKTIETTKLTPESTVGEIVAMNYHAAAVFRKYGLDFCCGGGISLQEACEKGNVYLDEILTQLMQLDNNNVTGIENFMAWEIPYLIGHITDTHHRFVRWKTDEITAYAEKVARVHGDRYPENIDIYKKFVSLTYELLKHLEAEEKVLFPLIEKIAEKRKKGEIVTGEEIEKLKRELQNMEGDHYRAGEVMKQIRKLSHNFTPQQDACTTYQILYKNLEGFEEDLHKHVHLENSILFKKAETFIAD